MTDSQEKTVNDRTVDSTDVMSGTSRIVTAPNPDAQQKESAIPEHLRGKSAEELAALVMEREKTIGRQGTDLSKLTRSVEELRKAVTKPDAESESIDPDDERLIRQVVTQQFDMSAERQRQLDLLISKHPQYESEVASEEFKSWATQSRARQLAFATAWQGGDGQAIVDLLDEFKGADAATAQAIERDRTTRATASQPTRGRRPVGNTYSRGELMLMKQRDPMKYRAMSGDIQRAYAEGRVTD